MDAERGQDIRKIIHVDMDAFYASVEQRDNPAYRGKPLAVGGSRERGVVAAASYEARQFGVRSAMPSALAYRKCPHLIFVKPRFDVYKAVSEQIRAVFFEYTDLVEPLSLDEAYLDVTNNKKGLPSATLIAREIRQRILSETRLTASAGISINKFLAKTASDINKPNGQFLIPPEKAMDFLAELPISKFYGIGKVTAEKMHGLGILKGTDLREQSEAELIRLFGKAGRYYYQIVRGIDQRPVNPNRIRKSIGAENTFSHNLTEEAEMLEELSDIAAQVAGRLQRADRQGRTLTIKIKFADFVQITRSRTFGHPVSSQRTIEMLAHEILLQEKLEGKEVRLLGITISNLDVPEVGGQLTIQF
ncbi:DNA polymerase IV [Nafulsella turpanensis]|uniref:DNA polymerase IV n=1 Tax=Nafulsella turpanensis TaxID=1265690 RepID=UPI000348FD44|nr:DNA polymerase IV [Nafulsella turpanensis]